MRRTVALASLAVAAALAGCGLHHHDDRNLTFSRGLRASPNPPTTIDKLTLSFDVVNDSRDDLDNIEWALNRDGAPFKSGVFAHIDSGDYDFDAVVFTETEGDHVYEFVIDPNNRISEWDENDNVSVIKVTVPVGGTG
jgi:hypothetical protein